MLSRARLRMAALASLCALAGCTSEPASTSVAAAPAKPAHESAAAAVSTPKYYETSGPIVVENQVDILAQRDGMVASIAIETGTAVQKGDLLAQLDDRQLKADRDAAQAKVKGLEANMKAWESEAKIFQNDYERDQEMFKSDLITAKQLEHSKFKVSSSTYELEREKQNLAGARAALESLELELEKTRIMAPFRGVVARRYINQGQKVTVNDRLFWITETAPLFVQFTLPENYLGHIAKGQEVTVILPSLAEETHIGRVKMVSPVADPSSGTIEVRAELEGPPRSLMPGANVVVRVNKLP